LKASNFPPKNLRQKPPFLFQTHFHILRNFIDTHFIPSHVHWNEFLIPLDATPPALICSFSFRNMIFTQTHKCFHYVCTLDIKRNIFCIERQMDVCERLCDTHGNDRGKQSLKRLCKDKDISVMGITWSLPDYDDYYECWEEAMRGN
jgi:hypothetical protein